jgi:hypothetical protein
MLCTRKTDDPLLKELLKRNISPLWMAKRQSPVGVIHILTRKWGGQTNQQDWRPEKALTPLLNPIEKITYDTPENQKLTDISSSNLDLSTTAQVVGRMLPGLSDQGKVGLKVALAAASAASCSVRLVEPKVERLRVDDLQIALRSLNFTEAFEEALKGGKAYFCTGGWSAKALEISATNKEKRSVKLLADIEAALRAHGEAGISLGEGANARSVFVSKEPLFFGAELMRIDKRKEGGLILTGYNPLTKLAGDSDTLPASAEEIWDENDDCILTISSAE